MQLYTEEQVLKIIFTTKQWNNLSSDYLISTVTPIELPSDEDIEKASWVKTIGEMRQYGYDIRSSFYIGAKWMKEEILNQNK